MVSLSSIIRSSLGLLIFVYTKFQQWFSIFLSFTKKKHDRKQRLYTNNPISDNFGSFWTGDCNKTGHLWSHVVFRHPATFNTLLIDPKMKEEVINDLVEFTKSGDYYAKTGKPWKRGYLLCGPHGTGKSSMVAAMANLLGYDVYDIELTAIKDNVELRKVLLSIPSKAIILFEDIDRTSGRKVTTSGLFSCSDGIWSAINGEEKIVIFTAQQIDRIDPGLIRKGRMDKRVQLSYCTPSLFKILAKQLLGVDAHALFHKIEKLLEETDVTPTDAADPLRPNISNGIQTAVDVDGSLQRLIKVLEDAKEEAERKTETGEEKADLVPTKFKHAKGSKKLPKTESGKLEDLSHLSYYI